MTVPPVASMIPADKNCEALADPCLNCTYSHSSPFTAKNHASGLALSTSTTTTGPAPLRNPRNYQHLRGQALALEHQGAFAKKPSVSRIFGANRSKISASRGFLGKNVWVSYRTSTSGSVSRAAPLRLCNNNNKLQHQALG